MNNLRLLFAMITVMLTAGLVFGQTTLTVGSGSASLDGIISSGEYSSSPFVTQGGVSLYAVADGSYLYFAASWTDASQTESIAKKQWLYDGSGWTQSGNEDRIAFVWDLGQNGSDGASCTAMCHGPIMRTNVGPVDVWHWKAARSNPMGYTDDKWWDTSDRQSDPGTSTATNNADVGGRPEFMANGDPGINADFLAAAAALADFDPFGVVQPAHTVAEAVPFDVNAAFNSGDVIPGYVTRVPNGDRASVQSAGRYDNGVWTVEFRKPYGGSPYDFAVTPGSSVDFTLETFDNEGSSHPNSGFDATVYTLDFSQAPSQTVLAVTPGTPSLDGEIGAGEWTSTPLTTGAGVTLYAMADGGFLYIAATWQDATQTETIAKKQWQYDGSNWSQSGDEDRISFVWDYGQNGSDGANCTLMCHTPLMRTNVGPVDVWHWKSARGNAMGVVDDKYWDTVDRQSDPGVKAYLNNSDVGGHPEFMASGDPGSNVDFLAADAAALAVFDPFGVVLPTHAVAEAASFDANAAFSAGDVIPGYLHQIPGGDRASVESAGKFVNGTWTVEFKRAYDTGSNFDFPVIPGGVVQFSHEIFDNEGSNHFNSGFDATVYSLEFSSVPVGIEDDPGNGALPQAFELQQNYPNPFNPSTTIEYSIVKTGRVTLHIFNARGQLVRTLVDNNLAPGKYKTRFDARGFASGVYFYSLTAAGFSQSKKMILIK